MKAPIKPPMIAPRAIREQLQSIANASLLGVAQRGFSEIDAQAERIKTRLKKMGIANADEFMDTLTMHVKKTTAELMTGRPQPQGK